MTAPPPEIARMTADQRRATAEMLATLVPRDWERPSRCEGWTVHQLVAHLTLPYTSRQTRVVKELAKARGSFDRAADRMARADAERYRPAELVQIVRDNVDHPWNPPGGGPLGALSHDVIHSYDVTDALGLPPVVDAERATVVLEGFRPYQVKAFGTDLRTTRFEATDADVATGADRQSAGEVVRAPLLELIPRVTRPRV